MDLPKRRILMNVLFKAQFNYGPIISVFRSRSLNDKVNRLLERSLRIIYDDKRSNFEELLVKDNSVLIHHNNIYPLAIEMYKVVNGISPEIMNDVFQIRNSTHYNLRYAPIFLTELVHRVFNGSESASYLGPKIWEQILNDVKMINCIVIPNLGFVYVIIYLLLFYKYKNSILCFLCQR